MNDETGNEYIHIRLVSAVGKKEIDMLVKKQQKISELRKLVKEALKNDRN